MPVQGASSIIYSSISKLIKGSYPLSSYWQLPIHFWVILLYWRLPIHLLHVVLGKHIILFSARLVITVLVLRDLNRALLSSTLNKFHVYFRPTDRICILPCGLPLKHFLNPLLRLFRSLHRDLASLFRDPCGSGIL